MPELLFPKTYPALDLSSGKPTITRKIAVKVG